MTKDEQRKMKNKSWSDPYCSLCMLARGAFWGFGWPMLFFGGFIALFAKVATHLGNPDALITSSIAIFSMLFGLIGAVAAIAAMPAAKFPEVEAWTLRAFFWLARYLRQRNYIWHWVGEAIGIYAYFLIQLYLENRGPDRALPIQMVFPAALVFVPAWKLFWTFLSFSTPVFLLRAIGPRRRIRTAQARLRLTMHGFRGRYKPQIPWYVFWLGMLGFALGAILPDDHWVTSYVGLPLAALAFSIPTYAWVARRLLEWKALPRHPKLRRIAAFGRLRLLKTVQRRRLTHR